MTYQLFSSSFSGVGETDALTGAQCSSSNIADSKATGSPVRVIKNRRRGQFGNLVGNGKVSYELPDSSDEEELLTKATRPTHLDTTVLIDQEVTDNETPRPTLDRQKSKKESTRFIDKEVESGAAKVSEDTDQDDKVFNDYIAPEMNYKDAAGCRSPPTITIRDASRNSFTNERDDISMYGTPKDELGPGFGEAKASFMRNQIEALFQPSDNKLAMKLFGSKKALMKERLRQKESGHWIIHPCSNFRSVTKRSTNQISE